MRRAVIFGTGAFAQVASVYLQEDADYTIEAFCVDEGFNEATSLLGIPVIDTLALSKEFRPADISVFCAIGFSKLNANRRKTVERLRDLGYTLPSYVHSSVQRWNSQTIGQACFIFENNVIQPFVTIGDNCVLWSGNHIGHHSTIGNNVFIASHAVISGSCHIGDNSFLGVNATLRDGISIGGDCVIGAGALILHDAPDGSVYKGSETFSQDRSSSQLRNF